MMAWKCIIKNDVFKNLVTKISIFLGYELSWASHDKKVQRPILSIIAAKFISCLISILKKWIIVEESRTLLILMLKLVVSGFYCSYVKGMLLVLLN